MPKRLAIRSARILILLGLIGSSSAAQGGFLTTVTVNQTTVPGDLFLYEYTLTNLANSDLPAVSFALSVPNNAALASFTGPTGWDPTYNPGDSAISWDSLDIQYDLLPDSSTGFAFVSPLGPSLLDYLVVGLDESVPRIEFNSGQITGPGASAVPEPSTLLLCSIGFLAVLGYIQRRR